MAQVGKSIAFRLPEHLEQKLLAESVEKKIPVYQLLRLIILQRYEGSDEE